MTLLHDWQVNTGTTDAAGNYVYANGDIAWDDDKIFNAAKMTVEMEYQHTAVDQFARTITPNLHEFVGYNSGENATISLDFAQVAYRFGHSTLRESIDLMDPERQPHRLDHALCAGARLPRRRRNSQPSEPAPSRWA